MNNQPNKPKISREQYERIMAKRRAQKIKAARRKRILTLIIAVVIIALVIGAVIMVKRNLNFKNPDEIFSTLESSQSSSAQHSDSTQDSTETTQSSQPTQSNENRISFVACGDNIIHEGIFRDAQNRAKNGEKYNFKDMYAGVADIRSAADLSYVVQETPMAGEKYGASGYPSFNTPQEDGDTLVDLGFDVVNIATNHMLDQGSQGLADSIDFWKTKEITLLGAFTKSDYDNIRTTTKNGITIAWISYTYSTNGYTLNSSSNLLIPYIDEGDIVRQAALASQVGDIVIATMHWGTDSSEVITSDQRRVAKLLCDSGVDVILGSHSHTLQDVEMLTSSDGSHQTLCYYSLGNLISSMLYYNLMVGGIASFDIVKDENGVRVENPLVTPIMCQYEKIDYGNTTSFPYNLALYVLEKYPAELVEKHGAQIDGAFTYNDLIARAKNAVNSEYLPAFYK